MHAILSPMRPRIILAIAVVFLLLPLHTYALSNQELIQKLLAQIQILQAELNALNGSSTCVFSRTLYQGVQGDDVTCLQKYLRAQGYFTETPTGLYGPKTMSAVSAWQQHADIIPEPKAIGLFGPRSQSRYVELMNTPESVPAIVPAVAPPLERSPRITGYSPKGVIDPEDPLTLTLTTNVPATCRYGSVDAPFAILPLLLQGGGTRVHTTVLSNIPLGIKQHYYARCMTDQGTQTPLQRVSFTLTSSTRPVATTTVQLPTTPSTVAVTPSAPPISGKTKWFIRPRGGSYGTEDGSSYANAFNGSEDAWTNPADIDKGDTVYICGNHTEMIEVKDSGTKSEPIILDGACPNDPGKIDSSRVVSLPHQDGIRVENQEYVTVQNFNSIGGARHGVLAFRSNGGTSRGITIKGNTIDNRNASDPTNVCHGIYFSGNGSFKDSSVLNNTVIGVSKSCGGQDNNDGINFEDGLSGNLISGNETYRAHEGIDVSGNGMTITSNYTHDNYYSGMKTHGINGCPVGTIVANNILANNAVNGMAFQDSKDSYFVHNVIVHSGTLMGLQIETVNSCADTGNVYANNIISSSYSAGTVRIYSQTKAEFETENTWSGNIINQNTEGSPLIYFNKDTVNNITPLNWDTNWIPAHQGELKNQVNVFGGGTGLKSFQLSPNSPAKGTGMCFLTGCTFPDFSGKQRTTPPSMGAF